MFYYPNVLHRHSGCFSTIWLAATKGIRVTRRELLRVNVRRTCQDIVDYVTAQVPPPQPNLPRPRFSLYLSSQLQYGVVIVYHRQCGFLLEEVQQTIERLLRSKRCTRIDMAEPDRLTLDMPDRLFMMEEAERAQDPFFGLMEPHQLPSPYKIHQPVLVIEEAASQHSLVPSPHTTPDREGFRSPPAAITLKEKAQLVIATAECFEGAELPEATAREIDLLMDQQDQFHGDVEERERERQAEERERTRELEGAMTSIDQLKEAALGPDRDSVWLLDEETGQPVEVPLATVAMETTPPPVAMPTPPCGSSGKERESERVTESPYGEVAVPPNKRHGGGRRRQLVFADPEVQISDKAMKEQTGNPLAETLSLSEMLLDLPSMTKHTTPAQLFSAPSGSLLHPDLQSLWKQCAQLTVLPRHGEKDRGEEEDDEEQDREILRAERKRRHSSMKEVDLVESGLHPTEASSVSDVILDMSKEDKSHSDLITPVSRWSPQEEAQVPMEPIVEENIEMPEAQTEAESGDIAALSLLSLISSNLQRAAKVTFASLLPPEADRTAAAHTLYKLLELVSARQLTVQQTKPYSTITINPGPLSMTA
ncbi:REC8 meiotic recombination protein b [Centroberyx gerrardi]